MRERERIGIRNCCILVFIDWKQSFPCTHSSLLIGSASMPVNLQYVFIYLTHAFINISSR